MTFELVRLSRVLLLIINASLIGSNSTTMLSQKRPRTFALFAQGKRERVPLATN